jgi:hypothetical protein
MARDFVQLDLLEWNEQPKANELTFEAVDQILEDHNKQKETSRRTDICFDWQACMHRDICFTPDNEEAGICFIDEPDKLPRGAFSRCEMKVLAAGFSLVRYAREEKKIELSEVSTISTEQLSEGFCDECGVYPCCCWDDGLSPVTSWTALEQFPTYAAAERKLKELKENGCIETGVDGKIIMTGWNQPGGLLKAGFEFYRVYGFHTYDTGHCIKVGSKNWSNLAKYSTRAELRTVWDKLMNEDPKALEG